MANRCTIKKRGVGEVSSKYGYDVDGKAFEADMQKHLEESERLYADFVEFMKSKHVDPEKFRYMFSKYYAEFIEPTESEE